MQEVIMNCNTLLIKLEVYAAFSTLHDVSPFSALGKPNKMVHFLKSQAKITPLSFTCIS